MILRGRLTLLKRLCCILTLTGLFSSRQFTCLTLPDLPIHPVHINGNVDLPDAVTCCPNVRSMGYIISENVNV